MVQTIASPPRSFEGIERLLFGDVVVAQSDWTRRQVQAESRAHDGRLALIYPPVPPFAPPAPERVLAARAELGVAPDAPIVLYPGDLETSSGAKSVEEIIPSVCERLGQAIVVFAYRAKTPRAAALARGLSARIGPSRGKVVGSVSDMLALLAGTAVVLFPVDDLYGKVDLPIVLLESMQLGVPVVTYAWGPLSELAGVIQVPPYDHGALVEATVSLMQNESLRGRVIAEQKRCVGEHHSAEVVARRYESLYEEVLRRRHG